MIKLLNDEGQVVYAIGRNSKYRSYYEGDTKEAIKMFYDSGIKHISRVIVIERLTPLEFM